MELMYPKSSGLDVHKNFVIACVYVCDAQGKEQAIRKRFGTMTNDLLELVRWVKDYGITHVVMESTGVYWKPVYNLLRPCFEVWVVNAHHLAKVPGRKTDDTDAMWITKLMRYGLLTRSFIPDEWQRDLRDLTRYRTRLQQEKSRNVNRLQKIWEDANIKLGSVVSDIQGVSARAIIDALIADELDTAAMANLAKGQVRTKIPQLLQALTGQVRLHHRFMLEEILGHLDHLNRLIVALSQQIQTLVEPYRTLIERLDEIPEWDAIPPRFS